MTLDQQIRDFNKKLKAKDLILNEWYDYDTKVFSFSIWARNAICSDSTGDCFHEPNSRSRRTAFNGMVARYNKEQS